MRARRAGFPAARAWLAAALASALVTPSIAAGAAPAVEVGLERLDTDPEARAALGSKRLGVVVHAASVTIDARHAIDILRRHGLQVVRLFAPEHGLRGRAAAGEAVTGGRDPESGLEVVSLYGDRRQPSAADLEGLDALVFDLQGAGVRFYTYVSTLIRCLQATAEAELELVVLDRPNPLGGERVEGPVSAPREVVPESFLNLAPGPLVHGLTLGEMARLVNARRARPARLTVIPLRGWSRAMTWRDTGRPWVAPSPNLRSPEAALAYPGVALLEATNLNEGRGTRSPFLLLGAPWLDRAALRTLRRAAAAVPGFRLHAARFTPRGSPAAPHPSHAGQPCRGLRVEVVAAAAAEPYRLGLTLLSSLARHPDFAWRDHGAALTRLLGTPHPLAALRRGTAVDTIVEADRADHRQWRLERRAALLY